MVGAAMFDVCLQCIDDDFLCTCSIVPALIFELVYSFILVDVKKKWSFLCRKGKIQPNSKKAKEDS